MADKQDQPAPRGLFRNDEPTATDTLGREQYARALADLALTCPPPMVIGIYGGWGTGKSSLMLQVRDLVKANEGAETVWFDPWQHQFDEEPLVALLQTMVLQLEKQSQKEVMQSLMAIALAVSSSITKRTLGLSFEDIRKIHEYTMEEQLRVRSLQIEMKEVIKKLLRSVKKPNGRLVFFIDDLDRCLPGRMLRMLEALKLYLNIEGCVYVLGLDHTVVRHSIARESVDLADYDRDYLEKIIQVPFRIPDIHEQDSTPFINGLLPEEAQHCADHIAPLIGRNPRKVKRFVNSYGLHLSLVRQTIGPDYSVDLVAALLLIQHRNEGLWDRIGLRPPLYAELATASDVVAAQQTAEYFDGDTQLQDVVRRIGLPEAAEIASYVHLADVAGASLREERTSPIEPETVTIGPGSFLMGSTESDDEQPQHEVTIDYALAVGRYPVTFAEFDRFVESTGHPHRPDDGGWGRGRRPVINVSWDDAQAYVTWLREETGKPYRLLSEAEWEFAARAGTATRYWWGDGISTDNANYVESGHGRTTPVDTYPANPWGLSDMSGNVWEWCADHWHGNYQGAPHDGRAWTEADAKAGADRVVRGGWWFIDASGVRSAKRHWGEPDGGGRNLGFRCARGQERAEAPSREAAPDRIG